MKVSLVYNPTAGGHDWDPDELVALVTDAGHDVRHRSSKDDWQQLLQDPGDLLVVAGGDGTVRDVALAAADANVPFAVLPFGTANNIGKTLGITGATDEVIGRWGGDAAAARPFDLGVAAGPWGEARFVESFGGGLFADLIAAGETVEDPIAMTGRETDRAVTLLADLVEQSAADVWGVLADGSDRSGSYLAVELLNVAFCGPNIPLALDASMTDGMLDLVLIEEEDRGALLRYLRSRLHASSGTIPPITRLRVREVELHPPPGVRLRLDDENWPSSEPLESGPRVRARVLAGAGRLLSGEEPPEAGRRPAVVPD